MSRLSPAIGRNARKPAKNPAYARFAALLFWHLFENGTRPDERARAPWTYAEFARGLESSRQNEYVSDRTVSNWCNALSLPERLEPLLRRLFGLYKNQHTEAREVLRAAFIAAQAKPSITLYGSDSEDPIHIPNGAWTCYEKLFPVEQERDDSMDIRGWLQKAYTYEIYTYEWLQIFATLSVGSKLNDIITNYICV